MQSPPSRLRDFTVGDRIILKGAAIEKSAALSILEIKDGYYLCWKDPDQKEHRLWDHAASGCHLAEKANERKPNESPANAHV